MMLSYSFRVFPVNLPALSQLKRGLQQIRPTVVCLAITVFLVNRSTQRGGDVASYVDSAFCSVACNNLISVGVDEDIKDTDVVCVQIADDDNRLLDCSCWAFIAHRTQI